MSASNNLKSIDDVLSELDKIIETTMDENSPLGIFAYVYRRTTVKVARGIEDGRFQDAERMKRFDITFAGFYIDAFWKYRKGQPVSGVWEVAFNAAKERNAIIIQYLLLGMNAHINLDLGVAAARIMDGEPIDDLKPDFMKINSLLAGLVVEMQQRIERVSPLLFLLDWIGQRSDEAIINFSITEARDFAWNFARHLASADEKEHRHLVDHTDHLMADLGKLVAHPPGLLVSAILPVIRFFEEKDMRTVIKEIEA